MTELEKALAEYEGKFRASFPILYFHATPDERIIGEVERCIQENKPYEPPDDGNDY